MRHGKKFNHLSRKSAHRKAMLSNMSASLILHKRIKTTVAKAKALKVYVEPLITRSKDDSTHSRRVVFSYLQNKEAVTELFREISVKVANRPGGYTRILKTGNRLGDNAEMCYIELVDYNENLLKEAKPKAKSTRRRRGGSKKAAESTTTEVVAEAPVVEESTSAETPAENTVAETETPVEEAPATEAAPAAEETKAEETPAVEEKVEEVKEEVKAEAETPAEEVAPTAEAKEAKEEKKESPSAEASKDEEETKEKE